MSDIVSTANIATELGVTFTVADEVLADRLRKTVEGMARQYVRWYITEDSYSHILPGNAPVGRVLSLPQPFVTDVESVHEDVFAGGGSRVDAFSAETLLVNGEDYFLDVADSSFGSPEGVIVRIGMDWPGMKRCVKVEYTAGLTEDQLTGDYSFVRDAIIYETVERLKYAKYRQGSGSDIGGDSGPAESERLKDYAVKYGNSMSRATGRSARQLPASGLLPETELKLNSIMSFFDWF